MTFNYSVAGFDAHGTTPAIYHCDVDGNATERNGMHPLYEADVYQRTVRTAGSKTWVSQSCATNDSSSFCRSMAAA